MSRVSFRVFAAACFAATVAASPALAADLSAPPKLGDGLPVASPAAAGLKTAPLAQLSDAVVNRDYPKTMSVLVVRDGKLAYEHYFGTGGRDVLNNTRSATKSITSLAAGAAIAEGAIASVHAPAFSYLSDLKPFKNDTPDKESITVEDLLTMSSALDCNDDDDNSPGNENNMHPQPNWTRWAVDLPAMQNYKRDTSGLGPWRYCTTGAFLLGQIVQRATHMPVDRYTEKKIFAPLAISKLNWFYSPSGETMTGGGLELRSRDFAKIAWMLADGGRWKGQQVVPRKWIEDAFTVHRNAYPGLHYGYLFWNRTYQSACGPVPAWYMAGNGGNAILIFKDLRAAVVVTRANYNTHAMHQQTIDLVQKYVLPSLPCATAKSTDGGR